jgi:hypothetical protein
VSRVSTEFLVCQRLIQHHLKNMILLYPSPLLVGAIRHHHHFTHPMPPMAQMGQMPPLLPPNIAPYPVDNRGTPPSDVPQRAAMSSRKSYLRKDSGYATLCARIVVNKSKKADRRRSSQTYGKTYEAYAQARELRDRIRAEAKAITENKTVAKTRMLDPDATAHENTATRINTVVDGPRRPGLSSHNSTNFARNRPAPIITERLIPGVGACVSEVRLSGSICRRGVAKWSREPKATS